MENSIKKNPFNVDRVYIAIAYIFITLFTILMLYPLIYVLSMSISDPILVKMGKVTFLPKGFNLGAFALIFESSVIWNRVMNSVLIVAGSVSCVLLAIVPAAYSLSQKRFIYRKPFIWFFMATMFFSGGMIPMFILIRTIGLYDTRLSVILPAMTSAFLLIIAKAYFMTIPESLSDAASIDGANQYQTLFRIYLPAVKPVMAVLVLYSGINAWNAYFNALLFIPTPAKQPIQLYLARIIMQNTQDIMAQELGVPFSGQNEYAALVKYAVIVATILPIMALYPLLQKYLVGGFILGSIKE